MYFTILVGIILVNNYVLAQFLGICPFLGVSKKLDSSVGMGVAVIFVIVFILIIAALVQFVEMALKKFIPALHRSLGVYLPLITTNCAVLGVCISNIDEGYNYAQALVNSAGAGIGFLLAMVLFSGMRMKLEGNEAIPKAFQGVPITLVSAAFLSLAFMGFGGLV